MIIPVKCFTCGKVLGNKYRYYLREVEKRKIDKSLEVNKVVYLTKDNMEKTASGEVLDILGLNKYCCRRHMITHVDIE
jgi:DNA-directed RNA polymerase subunit N (RpoN/RPB10)